MNGNFTNVWQPDLHHVKRWSNNHYLADVWRLKLINARVQKGAVCQWSLLCVKQVRPGRLQSSPFLWRFFSFLSFFLLRISLYNWAFPSMSRAASLSDRNVREDYKGVTQTWHQPLPSLVQVTAVNGGIQRGLPEGLTDARLWQPVYFHVWGLTAVFPIFSGMTF